MLHKNKTENPPNVECGNAAKIAGKNHCQSGLAKIQGKKRYVSIKLLKISNY